MTAGGGVLLDRPQPVLRMSCSRKPCATRLPPSTRSRAPYSRVSEDEWPDTTTRFRFTVGSRVRLLAIQNHVGTVQQRRQTPEEPEYEIFFELATSKTAYNESDSGAADRPRVIQPIGWRVLLRNLGGLQREPSMRGLSDLLYSYTGSRGAENRSLPIQACSASSHENGSSLESSLRRRRSAPVKQSKLESYSWNFVARMRLAQWPVVCPSRVLHQWQSDDFTRESFAETMEDMDIGSGCNGSFDDDKKYGTAGPASGRYSGGNSAESLTFTVRQIGPEFAVTFDLVDAWT